MVLKRTPKVGNKRDKNDEEVVPAAQVQQRTGEESVPTSPGAEAGATALEEPFAASGVVKRTAQKPPGKTLQSQEQSADERSADEMEEEELEDLLRKTQQVVLDQDQTSTTQEETRKLRRTPATPFENDIRAEYESCVPQLKRMIINADQFLQEEEVDQDDGKRMVARLTNLSNRMEDLISTLTGLMKQRGLAGIIIQQNEERRGLVDDLVKKKAEVNQKLRRAAEFQEVLLGMRTPTRATSTSDYYLSQPTVIPQLPPTTLSYSTAAPISAFVPVSTAGQPMMFGMPQTTQQSGQEHLQNVASGLYQGLGQARVPNPINTNLTSAALTSTAFSVYQNSTVPASNAHLARPSNQVFSSSVSSNDFYHRLPHPWNVEPVLPLPPSWDGTKAISKGKLLRFDGKVSSYINWRTKYITTIHVMLAPVLIKLLALKEALNTGDPRLRNLSELQGTDQATYKMMIETLEQDYGGVKRTIDVALKRLDNSQRARKNDVPTLSALVNNLKHYIEILNQNGRYADTNSSLLYVHITERMESSLLRDMTKHLTRKGLPRDPSNFIKWAEAELLAIRAAEEDDRHASRQQWTSRQPTTTKLNERQRSSSRPSEPHKTFYGEYEEDEFEELEEEEPFFDDEELGEAHEGGQPQDEIDYEQEDEKAAFQFQKLAREKCDNCDDLHLLKHCKKFMAMKIPERREFILRKGRCFRCLRKECQARTCPRNITCRQCKGKHNTLLHPSQEFSMQKKPNYKPEVKASNQASIDDIEVIDEGRDSSSFNIIKKNEIALGVIPVTLQNPKTGRKVRINALIDTGNNVTLISTSVAKALDLESKPHGVRIVGCGGKFTKSNERVQIDVCLPNKRKDKVAITAQIMENPAHGLSPIDWNVCKDRFEHLKDIDFPQPCSRTHVDLILGNQVPRLLASQCKDVLGDEKDDPIARKTPLGWVASGKTDPDADVNCFSTGRVYLTSEFKNRIKGINNFNKPIQVCRPGTPAEGGDLDLPSQKRSETFRKEETLEKIVERSWRIEESPDDEEPALSKLESKALNLLQTESKMVEGKIQAPCLWRRTPELPQLPYNYREVRAMYEGQMKKKDMQDPKKRKIYDDVFIDWLKRDFIQEANMESGLFYLPHFPVIRSDKTSTTVRPVFNGAARFKGVSLNDEVLSGPSLINDLPSVLIYFRLEKVAIAGDVAKMFLNIRMSQQDKEYHHFFWSEAGQPTREYAFCRHIFGNAGSPCIAIFTIKNQAKKMSKELPLASKVVLDATIVDDNMYSCETIEEAKQLIRELQQLYEGIGMKITKFISNEAKALSELDKKEIAPNLDLSTVTESAEELPVLKTLGVIYIASEDVFTFKLKLKEERKDWTKRLVLKLFATLYDPLGLISPFLIMARICFQRLWERKYDWDDQIGGSDLKQWQDWVDSLPLLQNLKIPRCLRPIRQQESLHIFTDASGDAYGCCAYLVHPDQNHIQSSLVMSRARLAPLQKQTIPRLELLGAVLGTELYRQINKVLKIPAEHTYFWTDSRNVLAWIHTEDKRLLTFVNNRVIKILKVSVKEQWRWVDTSINPADLTTRGALPDTLKEKEVWWKGPLSLFKDWKEQWKQHDFDLRNSSTPSTAKKEMSDLKATTLTGSAFSTMPESEDELYFSLENFGQWKRAVRVAALCLRWKDKVLNRSASSHFNSRRSTPTNVNDRRANVTAVEFRRAETTLLRIQQAKSFPEDYTSLTKGESVPLTSKILQLRPILDEQGLIRMNARLRFNRNLAYEEKYPILLPAKTHLTDLIVRDVHADYNHCAGVNYTLSLLTHKYWLIKGRSEVRRVLNGCVICRRINAKPSMQQMGPLPDDRSVPSKKMRAFQIMGIDCAGPWAVKLTKRTRGTTADHKRYALVVTCYITRALHFEMIETLDTDSMLSALQRVFARRGVPEKIYSDNGRNFIGAANVLGRLSEQLEELKPTFAYLYPKIIWKFNPPISPHVGGAFERHVASLKRALAVTLPKFAPLTQEDLLTALTVAEGMLNERPLSYESNDPNDLRVLTPNHFLHGQIKVEVSPDAEITSRRGEAPQDTAKRWKKLNEILDEVWTRYLREIVPSLNKLDKWTVERRAIQVGDLVTLFEEKTRSVWPLARVEEVYKGQDGLPRTAKIRCNGRELVRSLNRIRVILENEA